MGLLSSIYGAGLSVKKYVYTEIKKPGRLPAKVISVGNVTLGGTGKTPAVIDIASQAKKRGLSPCILTRGYKGKARGTCFISRGKGPLIDAKLAGDEAWLMAWKLKGVSVVKGIDRYRAGLFALENEQLSIVNMPQSRLFILDDGFQHWKLRRNVDILLIDATNPFGNRKLFPEGIMREPFSALKRADVFVITKSDTAGSDAVNDTIHEIRRYNHEAPVFTASHRPAALIDMHGNTRGLETLDNRRIYAFAGIANPSHFRATLRSSGADIAGFSEFRDHYFHTQKDMDRLVKEASGLDIITTEKDMVKLRDLKLPDNIYALSIEFSVDNNFYDCIFNLINV